MTELVSELLSAGRGTGGAPHKIETLFGDQPDVLDAIRTARLNGASIGEIARILSERGEVISEGAVRNWLRSQGVK